MKKLLYSILLAGLLLSLTTPVYAMSYGPVVVCAVSNQTINATGTYTSAAIDLTTKNYRNLNSLTLGVSIKVTSATGTPDVKIEVLCYEEAGGTYIGPENTTGTATGVIIASTNTAYADEDPHITTFTIPLCRSFKVLVTGVGSNPADTKAYVYLIFDVNP